MKLVSDLLRIPIIRLLIGIIKVIGSIYVFLHVTDFAYWVIEFTGETLYMNQIGKFLFAVNEFGWLFGLITMGFLLYKCLYYLCDGVLNIVTWQVGPLPMFDKRYLCPPFEEWEYRPRSNVASSKSQQLYPDIKRIYEYRDALMHQMGREKASKLYASTQSAVNTIGHNGRMMEYIACKLHHMGRDNGLKYLQKLSNDNDC